jgi:hypothetical protein
MPLNNLASIYRLFLGSFGLGFGMVSFEGSVKNTYFINLSVG